jgi:ectoine hydroxylase-related dioxygenase (phytanoyl-CoA dioxygenase family)
LAKSQGYWKAPAHQDWRSIQGSLNSVVIWVPLLSIDKSLGALEVVPGSHCDGLMSTTEDDFYRAIDDERYTDESFVPVETTIGDCLLFSTFLVHRSGTNSTNRVRWSCHFRFNDMLEKTFIEREFPNPYIYKPQQELITPNFPHQNLLVSLFKNEIS